MTHRIRLTLALILAALSFAAVPAAAGTSGDNRASAINHEDDTRATDVAFSVVRQNGGAVDNRNVAEAYSSCERCGAVAIAFQVVLASGDVGDVTPLNVAAAVNEKCEDCESYAGARQFVRVTREPVRLSGEGRKQVSSIKRALRRLSRTDSSAAEFDAGVDAQADRLRAVLDSELEPVDDDDDDVDEVDSDEEEQNRSAKGAGAS